MSMSLAEAVKCYDILSGLGAVELLMSKEPQRLYEAVFVLAEYGRSRLAPAREQPVTKERGIVKDQDQDRDQDSEAVDQTDG